MENDWILRTAVSNTTHWMSITYGNGLFVAVGNSETQGKIMTSRNGINWTTNNFMIGFHYGWKAITYANGIFVAGGQGGPGEALDIFITSPDGLNWTLRQAELFSRMINGITYGNGLFVAVGENRYIQTSPDGISWSYRTCSMDNNRRFISVTYGNGLFVAISEGYQLCTSPDGINWSLIHLVGNDGWVSLTYGNGLFVIGGNAKIITSPNGINWTNRSVGFGVSRITYAKELFVVLSYGSYAISSNGINWTLGTFPLDTNQLWYSIIYTEDIFIAVTSGVLHTYNILTNGVKLIDPIFGTFSIPTKTFGENVFTITAPISTSDGLFTYTSSNTLVATIVDDIITIVGPGTSIITATQLKTTNYFLGTITTTFQVNSATPTISDFTIPAKTFGDTSFSITNPTSNSTGSFSYTSSNTSVATISGNTITIIGSGTSTITATQAATSNYTLGTITTTFQVNSATPTISDFTIPTKTFGENIFTITDPTSNSSGSFSYTSSNTSVATISGNTITIIGSGTSTITATQVATSNYTLGTITTIFPVNINQQSNPAYIYNTDDLYYLTRTTAKYGYIVNSIEVSNISSSTTKVLFTTSNFIVITGNSV